MAPVTNLILGLLILANLFSLILPKKQCTVLRGLKSVIAKVSSIFSNYNYLDLAYVNLPMKTLNLKLLMHHEDYTESDMTFSLQDILILQYSTL